MYSDNKLLQTIAKKVAIDYKAFGSNNVSLLQYITISGLSDIVTLELNAFKEKFCKAFVTKNKSEFESVYAALSLYLTTLGMPVTQSASQSTSTVLRPIPAPSELILPRPHTPNTTSTSASTNTSKAEDFALALELAKNEAALVQTQTTKHIQRKPSAELTGDPVIDAVLQASVKQLVFDSSDASYTPILIPESERKQVITGNRLVNPNVINISDKVGKQYGQTCGYHSYKNIEQVCQLCTSNNIGLEIAKPKPTMFAGSKDEEINFPLSNWKKIVQDYRTSKRDLSPSETLTWDEIMHLVATQGKLAHGSLIAIPNILSFLQDINESRIQNIFVAHSRDEVNKLKIALNELVMAIRAIQDATLNGTHVTYGFALCNIDSKQSVYGHWRGYVVDVKDTQPTIYIMDSGKGANLRETNYGNEPGVIKALIELLNYEADFLQGTINSIFE